MIWYVILVPIGYFLGAIPIGLLVGRVARGIDVREFGSGKVGTTNVLRTVGRPAAALVLSLDAAKTVVAVLIARAITDSPGPEIAAALSVLIGHNWSIFGRFKGGRGAAPGLGGLFIFSPWAALASAVLGLPTMALTRYMSLGSIVGALSGGSTLLVLGILGVYPIEYGVYGLITGVVIILSHRDNIRRILAGRERRIGEPTEPNAPQSKTKRERGLRWPRSAS